MNLWFQPIVKKSCGCGAHGVQMFAWGEYDRNKWWTVCHFCAQCFVRLFASYVHKIPADVHFKARSGHTIPAWIEEQGRAVIAEKASIHGNKVAV